MNPDPSCGSPVGDLSSPDLGHDRRRLALARTLRRRRQQRFELFGDRALALHDPAWDLLLTASIADLEGRALAIGEARAAIDMPDTIGSRWVNYLVAEGLLDRTTDGNAATALLSLSAQGAVLMTRYLDLLLSEGE